MAHQNRESASIDDIPDRMLRYLSNGLVLDDKGMWIPIAARAAKQRQIAAHLSRGDVLLNGEWFPLATLKRELFKEKALHNRVPGVGMEMTDSEAARQHILAALSAPAPTRHGTRADSPGALRQRQETRGNTGMFRAQGTNYTSRFYVPDPGDWLGPALAKKFDELGMQVSRSVIFLEHAPTERFLESVPDRMTLCLAVKKSCGRRTDFRIVFDQAGYLRAHREMLWHGASKDLCAEFVLDYSLYPDDHAIHINRITIGRVFSCVGDPNTVDLQSIPGLLAQTFGAIAELFTTLYPDMEISLLPALHSQDVAPVFAAHFHADPVEPEDMERVAGYADCAALLSRYDFSRADDASVAEMKAILDESTKSSILVGRTTSIRADTTLAGAGLPKPFKKAAHIEMHKGGATVNETFSAGLDALTSPAEQPGYAREATSPTDPDAPSGKAVNTDGRHARTNRRRSVFVVIAVIVAIAIIAAALALTGMTASILDGIQSLPGDGTPLAPR